MACATCSSPPLSIGQGGETNAAFDNCPFNPKILTMTTVHITAAQLGPGFNATVVLTIPFNPEPQTISVDINQSNILSVTNTTEVITGDYTVLSKIVSNGNTVLNLYLVPRSDPNPANLAPYPYYTFLLFYNGSVLNITASYHSCGTSVSTPPLPENMIPNLFATAYLTPDGQNICQVDITTITGNECCNGLIRITTMYTKYFVPMQDVICAKGCTLTQKVDNLGVDFNSFVSNALLRYVLSYLLFGCFDVNYLRQRYYERFLKALSGSIWKAFLPYFNNDYWKLFKK
jgi:hypothetical protein